MKVVYIDRKSRNIQTFTETEGNTLHCLAQKTTFGTIVSVWHRQRLSNSYVHNRFYIPENQSTLTLGARTYFLYG